MSVRVGINGFGRMGRLGLRAGWKMEDFEVVQVNEIACGAECSAHLLKFDSVHGTWPFDCHADGDVMLINGQRISHSSNQAIEETDWSGCDIVIEASGNFARWRSCRPTLTRV